MANVSKGASLDPSTHTKGGAVPDGDYIIKSVSCEMFDYGGNADAVPAIAVLYVDPNDPAVTYEQNYSAGKADRLTPGDDKKRMVHPRGEAAAYAQGSNASLWLSSIVKAGLPTARMAGDDVTVFAGSKVTVTSVAQPKRPGLKGDADREKVIPLITKVIALPGEKAARPSGVQAGQRTAAPSTPTPAAASAANGDLDSVAIQAIMQALEASPEHSLKVRGLAVRCLKYAPGTKLNDLTKLITADWLVAQGEATGWTTDGEVVAL